MRQDHDAAADRRLRGAVGRRDSGVGNALVSSPATNRSAERRNMSMIFQSYALWPHMTVAENVAYGLKLRKVDRARSTGKLGALLATTHLGALAERYPGELSGGQPAAGRTGRALIVEPETLLLDEPLSNLDDQSARGDALRSPPSARRISLYDGLRHPRSVRGDDHG